MSYLEDPDSLLPSDFASEEEALAAFAIATKAIHDEVAAYSDVLTDDGRERIRKWIERLLESVKAAAKKFDADGFGLTVGWPVGASVTINWKTEE